ncbi:MAG: endonuclease [Acholeplasmataceae bacterium]|jgi:endonuclease I
MKNKRMILTLIIFIIASFLLVGCKKKKPELTEEQKADLKTIEEFKELNLLVFVDDDDVENIHDNFALVTEFKSHTIHWSSNSAAIRISGSDGIVTNGSEDETVILTATIIVRDDLFEERKIQVVVKKAKPEIFHEIFLDLNGGTYPHTSITVRETDKLVIPDEPVKAGYKFVKWTLNGEPFDFNTKITSSMTLVANYERLDTIKIVTLILEEGAYSPDIPRCYLVESGTVFNAPESDPIKAGYRFDGWALNGVKFDLNTPITEDITLTPIFIEQVLVNIDLKGGQFPDSQTNPRPNSYLIDKGTKFTEEIGQPEKYAHQFMGWKVDGVLFDLTKEIINQEITLEADYEFDSDIIFEDVKTYLLNKYENEEYLQGQKIILISQVPNIDNFNITWTTTPSNLLDSQKIVSHEHSGLATLKATITYLEISEVLSISISIKEGGVPPSDYGTYYDEITASSGTALVSQLNELVTGNLGATGSGNITYGEVRYLLPVSDLNINNRNKIWGIYDGANLNNSWDGSWDREHVWPQSRLSVSSDNSRRNIASDPHNLRACTKSVNSSRGNNYFAQGSGTFGNLGGGTFYPGDDHKGDVARILLYMAVRYRGTLTLVDVQRGENYTIEGANLATLSILLDWHLEDLPDEFERQRNNAIQDAQGNRNPFIDKPNYFQPVWEVLMEEENLTVAAIEKFEHTVQTYETLKTIYILLEPRYTI